MLPGIEIFLDRQYNYVMKKHIACFVLGLFILTCAFAQDVFSGKYTMENQADYDANKRWIEITRNQYQEIIINSESYNNLVAYFDEESSELFYVQKKGAQYNTLIKIKILRNRKIEVYMLEKNRWQKYPSLFVK